MLCIFVPLALAQLHPPAPPLSHTCIDLSAHLSYFCLSPLLSCTLTMWTVFDGSCTRGLPFTSMPLVRRRAMECMSSCEGGRGRVHGWVRHDRQSPPDPHSGRPPIPYNVLSPSGEAPLP